MGFWLQVSACRMHPRDLNFKPLTLVVVVVAVVVAVAKVEVLVVVAQALVRVLLWMEETLHQFE